MSKSIKILVKVFLSLLLVFFLVVLGGYVYLNQQSQQILSQQLNNIFDQPVMIGDVDIVFPPGVSVQDFRIEGQIQAKELKIQLADFVFWQDDLHISNMTLIQPIMVVHKFPDSGYALGEKDSVVLNTKTSISEQDRANNPKKTSTLFKEGTSIKVDNLLIQEGELAYVDHSSDDLRLVIKNFELIANNLHFPEHAVETKFDFSGTLFDSPLDLNDSRVTGHGSLDWSKKNMDAKLQVLEADDQVGLSADLHSFNNAMSVKGTLRIANMNKDKKLSDPGQGSLQDMIFEGLRSAGVSIGLHFAFKTKMDNFRVEKVALSGEVGYDAQKKTEAPDIPKDIGRRVEVLNMDMKQDVESVDEKKYDLPEFSEDLENFLKGKSTY